MSLPVRIVVRTDTDWSAMSEEIFYGQSDPLRPVTWIESAGEFDIFGCWNRAFPLTFFEYRRRLQEITMASVERAAPAAVSIGLDDAEEWLLDGNDEIIVSMDDDDFVRPDVCDVAAHFTEGVSVVIWPAVYVGLLDGGDVRGETWVPFRQILPLNTAYRKSYLAEHFSVDDAKVLLAHHAMANRLVADDLEIPDTEEGVTLTGLHHPAVELIGECYGIYNVHVGSISFLKRALGGPDPVEFLRHLDLTSPMELPEHIADFEPYVRALEEIWSAP